MNQSYQTTPDYKQEELVCRVCKKSQPLTEYYENKAYKNGYEKYCKTCRKAYNYKWYDANKEHVREQHREYRSDERVKKLELAKTKRLQAKYPEKTKARYMVRDALSAGKITKPDNCTSCDATGRLEGHHNDYSKPLDVEWLCVLCHKAKHGVLTWQRR